MKNIALCLAVLLSMVGFVRAEDEPPKTFKTQFAADKLVPVVEKQAQKMSFRPLTAKAFKCHPVTHENQAVLCLYKFNKDKVLIRHMTGNPKAIISIIIDLGEKTNITDFMNLGAVMVKLVEPKMSNDDAGQLILDLSTNAAASGMKLGTIQGTNAEYMLYGMTNLVQLVITPIGSSD